MSKPARSNGISQAQRRMLYAARQKLGMDDSTYRALLERVAGVRSSTELDQERFDVVMRALERAGFHNTSRDKPYGARPGFATGPQVALITNLAARSGARAPTNRSRLGSDASTMWNTSGSLASTRPAR